MTGNDQKPHASPFGKKFGELCVDKGWCTPAQVDKALKIQKEGDSKGEPHKLIGIIMVENGIISTTQLIEMLRDFEKERASKTG